MAVRNPNKVLFQPDRIYEPALCDRVVALFSDGESVAGICSELGITKTTYYQWIKDKPEFAIAVERGKNHSQRHWERIGHQGIGGDLKNFSGPTWAFVMKSRFRDDYAENKEKSSSDVLIEKLLDKLVDE